MRKATTGLVLLVVLALMIGVFAVGGCAPAPKKVGVQSGTTGEAWAKENLKGATIVPFKTATEAFSALQAGNVDAVVNDLPVSKYLVKDTSRGLKIVQEIPTGEQYGFAVSKDNPKLTAGLNYGLAKVKASGKYDEIYKKWFGEAPKTATVASAPAGPAPSGFKTVVAGTLKVGSDTFFPPFESLNGAVIEGFDVDLMAAIAQEIGLKSVFQTETFDTLIPTLKAGGKFDVIATSMTITADRLKEIDFTNPYIDSNQSIAVKTDSPIKSAADLKK